MTSLSLVSNVPRVLSEGEISHEYRGWWRIVQTSQWDDADLDILGPALLSLTGYVDRLGMHCLLAYVNCKPTKTGVSLTWEGAAFDQLSGTDRVTLGKDGCLKGRIKIKNGDANTFVAERATEPVKATEEPPTKLPWHVATALTLTTGRLAPSCGSRYVLTHDTRMARGNPQKRERVAPSGFRRSCSQLRSVCTLMPSATAKSVRHPLRRRGHERSSGRSLFRLGAEASLSCLEAERAELFLNR